MEKRGTAYARCGPFCMEKYILYEKKQKIPKCRTKKVVPACQEASELLFRYMKGKNEEL